MPRFGSRSLAVREELTSQLAHVVSIAIERVDFSLLCGFRGQAEQDYLESTGASKLRWPHSRHNVPGHPRRLPTTPGVHAFDFAPYPIDWNDIERFRFVAFYMRGIANGLGFDLRLGADWDGDFSFRDQSFHDVGHVELLASPSR